MQATSSTLSFSPSVALLGDTKALPGLDLCVHNVLGDKALKEDLASTILLMQRQWARERWSDAHPAIVTLALSILGH